MISLHKPQVEKLIRLDPHIVKQLHYADTPSCTERLVQAIEQFGWCSRPILVVQKGKRYRALTGTHRIEAARICNIRKIICLVIQGEVPNQLIKTFEKDQTFKRYKTFAKELEKNGYYLAAILLARDYRPSH